MSRLYLLCVLVIAGAALLGLAIAADAGYVLIRYDRFRYQSSFWVFVAVIVALWLAVLGLRTLLRLLGVSGGLINPWSRRHRNRRVRLAARRGLLDLAEGGWARALRHLRRAASQDPQPLVHYLGAARAANELGEYEESDSLLRQAQEQEPQAEVAIDLTRAQLQLARGEAQQAQETLQRIRDQHPRQREALKLQQQIYVEQQNWSALCALLPELRKQRVMAEEPLLALERHAWLAALAEAGNQGLNEGETALQPLTGLWQRMPSALRSDPVLIDGYAEQLSRLGAPEEAEEILRGALKRDYVERLVYRYGLVRGRDPARQLQTGESWLKAHPNDPVLLLTLGRLCLLNQLWGKAREYLEASLSFRRSVEACTELARLLAQLGAVERSNELFQEALELFGQSLPGPAATADRVPGSLPLVPV